MAGRRFGCGACLAVLGAVAFSPVVAAQSVGLESMEMRGTVGPYPVGLSYTTRNHTELVAAHYFYTLQLKDIALTGQVRGEAVEWQGADGSVFHLHFVGNGSNGKDPLTFYNSVGLKGTWTQKGKTLPVTLEGEGSTANPGERLYGMVTAKSDAEFEGMVAKAKAAILSGNVAETAKYVHFPLRVNGTKPPMRIANEAELKAQWARVFTPALLLKIRGDVPHEMFVRNGEAMLGDGELWFDDKGLSSVNPGVASGK